MFIDNNVLQQEVMVEIRSTVYRTGRPTLVPYVDRHKYTGFTSVYGYLKESVAYISSVGSTRGINAFPVYSDVLYVDFDDNEAAALKFKQLLDIKNYSYERYHSGGRSIHFHISIEPMQGMNVPYSQRAWMEQYAPDADMSIYRHTGLYRLPGTYHAKNPGKRKVLLDSRKGALLRIENRPRVQIKVENEEKDEAWFHGLLGALLHKKVSEGERHPHAFKVAITCRDSGKSETHALKLLGMWNHDNCYPPKADWELEKLIRWVYGN